ncbi:Pentatricopeptide repeat [Dillenia turbinata]|uniref:Pentatricopeptide repeat n=1 Tax=Dillenia turbinata TaxID=194707 RepID=A0AAN8URC2_9MAGN
MPERSVVTWNTIISGLTNTGIMEIARLFFERTPEKNEISWNSIILGYAKVGYINNKMFDQAFSVFNLLLIDGKCRPDQTTLISVLSTCAQTGSLEQGKWVECYIPKKEKMTCRFYCEIL